MSVRVTVVGFAALVGVFFAAYAALRSPDLMAVDGPFRSCEVFHRSELFFHGNNHLLYPVNVWTWDRLLRPLLGPSCEAYEFARRTQLMNGLAMALSVGVVFLLARSVVGSSWLSAGTALAYGCSRAVLLHATNAAEPPVGLLLSGLGVAAAAGSRGRSQAWLAGVAGMCLAAAMATYQTTILIGPAVLYLCAARSIDGGRREQVLRVLYFFAGSVVGTVAIYSWAYSHQGIVGVPEQFRRFFTVDGGSEVYGGLSASKVVNTPVGLIGHVYFVLPEGYSGLRNMWRDYGFDGLMVRLIAIALVSATAVIVLSVEVWRRWGQLDQSHRLAIRAALVALACTLVGPLYWQPLYDKMWLQPVAIVVLLVGFGLAAILPSRTRSVLTCVFAALLVVEVVSNGVWALPEASRAAPYVNEAREVEGLLQPNDLVIFEWDGVSMLYAALSGPARPGVCLPTAAHEHGPAVVARIQEQVAQAKARNAKVYFIGILDASEASWQPFLGDRLGVPYRAFDEFRRHSRPVKTFLIKGKPLTVHVYEPR